MILISPWRMVKSSNILRDDKKEHRKVLCTIKSLVHQAQHCLYGLAAVLQGFRKGTFPDLLGDVKD